jgi:hypothetical protein
VVFGANQTEYVSGVDAAAPGDILVLFGTGLGPVTGGSDNTLPLAGNLGTAPTVYVGGVASSSVSYYGRSPCCAGLDQIVFTVPPNAPLGCQVSIIVQTSNGGVPIVSNGPATAIGATHHTPCSDPVDAFPPALLSFPVSSSILGIALQQNIAVNPTTTPPKSTTTDNYQILVTQFTPAQFAALAPLMAQSSNNSCFAGFVPATAAPIGLPQATYLDIGPSVTLTPPSGTPFPIPAAAAGVFVGQSSAGIAGGNWGFTTSGGANVGPLNFNFPVPQPVVWTNQTSVLTTPIDRTKGLTITWSGGDQFGFVDIQGFAANATGSHLVGYDCSAAVSAGSFTIPPSVLLRMPAGTSPFTTIQVSTFALPFTILPVKGFDVVANFSQLQTIIPVAYK